MSGEYRSQAEDAGTIVAVWRRLGSAWSLHPERNTAIVLGLLTTFWLLELLIPTFEQIAPHDDTAYIRSGHWLVADGALRVYVWGPLLSALYGLAYVVVQESVNLVCVDRNGRETGHVRSVLHGGLPVRSSAFAAARGCARGVGDWFDMAPCGVLRRCLELKRPSLHGNVGACAFATACLSVRSIGKALGVGVCAGRTCCADSTRRAHSGGVLRPAFVGD